MPCLAGAHAQDVALSSWFLLVPCCWNPTTHLCPLAVLLSKLCPLRPIASVPPKLPRNRAILWFSWVLGTFAFAGHFLHKNIVKVIFYNCVVIKTNILILHMKTFLWLKVHLFFFLLALLSFKDINTLTCIPKSTVGPKHWASCTWQIRQPPCFCLRWWFQSSVLLKLLLEILLDCPVLVFT